MSLRELPKPFSDDPTMYNPQSMHISWHTIGTVTIKHVRQTTVVCEQLFSNLH